MHIFLIRHGQSIANTGENYPQRLPDHLVSLTEEGIQQARENGEWLANYCKEKNIDLSNARIWRSPYLRTRQTSEEFNKFLNIKDIREDITLIEQQFGLLDSVPDEEWANQFPIENAEKIFSVIPGNFLLVFFRRFFGQITIQIVKRMIQAQTAQSPNTTCYSTQC